MKADRGLLLHPLMSAAGPEPYAHYIDNGRSRRREWVEDMQARRCPRHGSTLDFFYPIARYGFMGMKWLMATSRTASNELRSKIGFESKIPGLYSGN